jgi:hypothetical protein
MLALACLDLTTPEIDRLVAAFVTGRITKRPWHRRFLSLLDAA